MVSNGTDGGTRHLALVFFDVLLIDDVSLVSFSYADRRAALERTIRTQPGYAMLAERTCIDLNRSDAEESCRRTFATLLANYQEGAVIKAECAQYGEKRWPWVKVSRLVHLLSSRYIIDIGDS